MTPEQLPGSAGPDRRHRLNFLDGLRGIAILVVMLFHSYARWPDLLPFGSRFAQVPVFYYGWLGVDLFFLISGFAIFMTLEKCENFRDFIMRRWLRLFPAMLICSIAVFASVRLFPERPAGMARWRDLLPGLTFIEPTWWGFLLGSPQGVIEGAFWSLFVEVKFYFVAGLLYFLIGGRKMVTVLTALFLCAAALARLRHMFPGMPLGIPNLVLEAASAGQFGWFAAGALYYRYFHERRPQLLPAACAVAIAAAAATGGLRPQQTEAALLVVLLFTTAVSLRSVRLMLSGRLLLYLGFISYPLYLLHENIMVAMIVKIGRAMPWFPQILMPLPPILAVIGAGSLIAVYIEPWLRRRLTPLYLKMRARIGIATPAM
ncbi:acyltransferase [Oxalobacteraceae bacterium CAVE-383]|nr:acyltransferase [Oxalobacteraceae bacterium CAVE-383]